MRRVLFSLTTLLTVCVTLTGSAVAATTQSSAVGNGFQISPVRSELTINKGQSQTVDITVTNPTAASINAEAVVNDFKASSNESGEPQLLLNGQTSNPSHDFKTLVGTIPNITIPANGSKDVDVTITVPSFANSGGYYGAIRFLPAGTNTGNGTVGLTASVGTLFLITVPGDLVEKLELTQLSAAEGNVASSFITSGQPQVLTRLNNVGDIHLQPFGSVNIKDMSGKTIYSYQFNNTTPRANILPDSIRKFIDPLPKRSWFGHYTIEANIAYANGSGTVLTASTGFWYLPVWFLVVLVVVIIALVALVYWFIRGRRRKKHRR